MKVVPSSRRDWDISNEFSFEGCDKKPGSVSITAEKWKYILSHIFFLTKAVSQIEDKTAKKPIVVQAAKAVSSEPS